MKWNKLLKKKKKKKKKKKSMTWIVRIWHKVLFLEHSIRTDLILGLVLMAYQPSWVM